MQRAKAKTLQMHETKKKECSIEFFGTNIFALGLRTTRQVVCPPPPLLVEPFDAASETSIAARARATDDVGEH